MSGMTEHPDRLLSAYLDDALTPDERAAVEPHLAGCPRCRARVDELRATGRLLAGLPVLAPSRALRPRVQHGWLWLRPVRLLGSLGTGAFLFLFLASYVLNSGNQLGGGTQESERLAEQGKFGAAASALAAENAQRAVAQPTAVAAAAPAAATAPAADRAAAPSGVSGTVTSVSEPAPRSVGPSPLVFLAFAVLCAIAALVAHRRLRRT